MLPEGSNRSQLSAAIPPRKINVQKYAESRALELKSLNSIIANRVNSDFRSQRNKRRRTTAYDNQNARERCRRKRRKLGIFEKSYSSVFEKDQINKLPRRVRRRLELKMNPESGFCSSGDGTKRLRTHVWHAKRFTMTKLWGYHLPLGLQGRGKGSRALFRRLKQGVLVHDASYCTALRLEGPEDSLISVLRMVLVPTPDTDDGNNDNNSVLSGLTYGTSMLCAVGAPSHVIAPVTYMWRPVFDQDTSLKLDVVEDRASFRQHDTSDEASIHDIDECDKSDSMRPSASLRQLWVWIHASAFGEGYDTLKLACHKEMEKRGIVVRCVSLDGQLSKLELMGPKAFQLLQKMLHPVTGISENHWQLKKHLATEEDYISQDNKSPIFKSEDNFSYHAMLSLNVKDPRLLPKKSTTVPMEPTLIEALCDAPHGKCEELPDMEGILVKNEDSPPPSTKLESDQYYNSDLWGATTRVLRPPFEDSVISKEKHCKRVINFCLDDENFNEANLLTKEQCSRSCPILLLKNDKKELVIGWSIILPLSWVKAFWIPLISNGAHAIGLREKHWIASEIGLPFFPSDFPDCKAYRCFMTAKAASLDHKAELRPQSMRPLRVPMPPAWAIVGISINKEPGKMEDPKVLTGKNAPSANSPPNSCHESFKISSSECDGNLFVGIVARTGCMLIRFLEEIKADQLLLFPHVAHEKARVYKSAKVEAKLDLSPRNFDSHDSKLCFLRVYLRPYKEGIFEEGAVVCAPCPSDISLRISSSEKSTMVEWDRELYFQDPSSGDWGLHIPDESIAKEYHRWPIGFITTPTVQGSKKLVAAGFCEAVLLACLREEQWKEKPPKRRKMEIYVLVRNPRSSVYRLALASIVLEHQENDVEFL